MDTKLTHQTNMEAILSSVENIISRLLSSSDEKKSEGYSMFEMMKEQDPNSVALALVQLVGASDSHCIHFRTMCARLLEELLTENKCYIWNNNLSESTQSTVKSILLFHINLEEYPGSILEALCYTVSALCNVSNNWPEPLHFLRECIASNSNGLKESFFFIFAKLAKHISQTLVPDIMILYPIFVKTMNDDTLHLSTRSGALAAAVKFIQCMSSLNELKRIQSLYPAMMRTLTDALSEGDQAARYVLQRYSKLAKNEPRFFRIHIVDTVNTMSEIAENMNLEEMTRHLALEFLLNLVEAREKAPGMMKKVPRFIHSYFALLLNLLLDVKDESSWHSAESCVNWEWGTNNFRIGWRFLNRFSNALGGMTVAPVAVEQIDSYLVHHMWENRHAALTALFFISRGCSKVMIKYLERLVSMVLHSFEDPHPRVRWAAFQSIAQLSTVFTPDLQERYHDQVVPALAAAMGGCQHPQVQASALGAVHNYFCKSKKSGTLLPYVDVILNKLLVLLKRDNQMVQQKALDALTAVAEVSKEHFRGYYDVIMPYMKNMLVNANDKSNHMLRSNVLECMSVVGLVVGIEKFRDDAKQVMEILKSSEESQVKEFGSLCYVLMAWGRIRNCLRKSFLPYMSTFMPLLAKCAQVQPDNIIDGLNNSIQKIKFGDEMIYVKRSDDFLKVKELACCEFGANAEILGEDFYPWISQATSTLVPLLKFYMDGDVRTEASTALFKMLESAKLAVEKGIVQGESDLYFKRLSCDIILALQDALYTEPETKVCEGIMHSLSHCVEICGPLLNDDMLPSIVGVIKYVITESTCRRGVLTDREKAEDFDIEEAELLREETEREENINRYVGRILRGLIETFKVAFLPFIDELSPYVMPTRGKDKTIAESITCILVFNGLVMHCSEAAQRCYDIYVPFLLESSNKENPFLRQCALSGLGLCAEHGVSVFKPFVGDALPRIKEVIMHLHAREPENEDAFDNAVSALLKICVFHRESIDSSQIIPVWLDCLPIKGDIDAAKDVHGQLSLMVERSETELLGPKYEHFPKVLSVFGEVLSAEKDLATEETINRMINVLRNLQKKIPPATWVSAWSLLLPQHEMELDSVLSPEEDDTFS